MVRLPLSEVCLGGHKDNRSFPVHLLDLGDPEVTHALHGFPIHGTEADDKDIVASVFLRSDLIVVMLKIKEKQEML